MGKRTASSDPHRNRFETQRLFMLCLMLLVASAGMTSCGGKQRVFSDNAVYEAFRAEGLSLLSVGLTLGSGSTATQMVPEAGPNALLVSVFSDRDEAKRWIELSKRVRNQRPDQWPTSLYLVKSNVVVNYRPSTSKQMLDEARRALDRLDR